MIKSSTNVLLACNSTLENGSGHVMKQITSGAALKLLGLKQELFHFSTPDALVVRALFWTNYLQEKKNDTSTTA